MFSHTDSRGKDVGDLEAAGEAAPVDLVRRQPGDILAVELHRPGGRGQAAADQVEQRRFSGPVRPDDCVAFACWHAQADATDDLGSTEILLQVDELDRGRAHFVCSAPCTCASASSHAAPTAGHVRRNRKKPPATQTAATAHDHAAAVSSVTWKIEIIVPSDALTLRW